MVIHLPTRYLIKMILLDTIMITSMGWTIIAFLIIQVIAFAKSFIGLSSRVKILENDLDDNTEKDAKETTSLHTDIKEMKDSCKNGLSNLKSDINTKIKEVKEESDRRKDVLYRKLTKIEEKSDTSDKKIWERADGIAQGLARNDEKINSHDKRIDKLEK